MATSTTLVAGTATASNRPMKFFPDELTELYTIAWVWYGIVVLVLIVVGYWIPILAWASMAWLHVERWLWL